MSRNNKQSANIFKMKLARWDRRGVLRFLGDGGATNPLKTGTNAHLGTWFDPAFKGAVARGSERAPRPNSDPAHAMHAPKKRVSPKVRASSESPGRPLCDSNVRLALSRLLAAIAIDSFRDFFWTFVSFPTHSSSSRWEYLQLAHLHRNYRKTVGSSPRSSRSQAPRCPQIRSCWCKELEQLGQHQLMGCSMGCSTAGLTRGKGM